MKIFFTIALTILLCSCAQNSTKKQKETSSIRVIDLESKPESKISDISEIASDIEYISLETNVKSLIKEIKKVILQNNYIYVQDYNNQVICFNNAGQLLYKINQMGRGPKEYLSLYNFDISSDNKTLVALTKSKIMIFNNTGAEFEFQKNINLQQPKPDLLGIVPETNNILLSFTPIFGSEPSLSILINDNGDTLCFKPNSYLYERPEKSATMAMLYECLQYKFENSLCFKEEFSDTVYSFNGGSKKYMPRIIFDSHGKGVNPRIRYDREYSRSHSVGLFWVYRIFEVPRYILYTYEQFPMRHRMIIDKITNKKYNIELKNPFIDDISGGPNFDPTECSEGKLISWIDAITLKKHVASKDFTNSSIHDTKKKEKLKMLANSLKETDNPILIIVSPKK